VIGQHNDDFFPHDAALHQLYHDITYLGVIDIVHLVENDKLDVTDQIRPLV
jgi:hypothetical protein